MSTIRMTNDKGAFAKVSGNTEAVGKYAEEWVTTLQDMGFRRISWWEWMKLKYLEFKPEEGQA